jgi:hypothetical protein
VYFGGSVIDETWVPRVLRLTHDRSTCPGLSGRPLCVAFSSDGSTLACGIAGLEEDSVVALFDIRTGSKKFELPGTLYFSSGKHFPL